MTMPATEIELCWLAHGAGLDPPRLHSKSAAGADLAAAIEAGREMWIEPGQRTLVPTGFCLALPVGYEAQIRPRSGLALKHGVSVLNAPGTIDADYRGEIQVLLINLGDQAFCVRRGDRIAQMVVAPVTLAHYQEVENLDTTQRGSDGFGSTG